MPELAKTYSPKDIEPAIAARWKSARAFHAEPDPGSGAPPYCIVIPPPNVTAALHMGHALNNTLQDILIRHHRMLGDNTVWVPGTDHAGIATQTVVEKRVLAEEGKRRTDFKREEFVARIQAWKDEYEKTILGQLKAMGCSCDWERTRFTMDEVCAKAVREAFFQLFKDGLIYRGKRLVNWDPATQTALADDEVEMEEIDGHFYYLKYPLADGSGHVTVATTRPETMLGDTAVAINPKDPRANALMGKSVRLPIVNRFIPIIEDDYVVLPLEPSPSGRGQGEGVPADDKADPKAKYTTGFLKVTPAHDPNDYEIGLRHALPVINVLAPDGTISKEHGWPAEEWARTGTTSGGNEADFLLGMDRFEARKAIVEWFRKENLLEEVKPYRHSVGHSYRSHVPIEPYLSDQWYVKVTDERLSGAALHAMAPDQRENPDSRDPTGRATSTSGGGGAGSLPAAAQKLRFTPDRYAKTFEQWHLNVRDWCISRQLWWGHRIPVWSRTFSNYEEYRGSGMKTANAAWQDELSDRLCSLEENYDRVCARFVSDEDGPRAFHSSPPERGGFAAFVCVRDATNEAPSTYEYDIVDLMLRQGFTQDPDVLDTWFSSALWPFSTLGWPDNTPELQTWNPGNVLCTAREIITLWVSRMVMMNLYLLGRLPFTDVFIHAMIQDGEGRKMSKSLGNGVDPLDIIHSHGSDAMRYTLAAMTTNTQDVRLPVEKDPTSGRNTSPKFDSGRNFSNKLWNAVRFALAILESAEADASGGTPPAGAGELSLPDRWILARLAATVRDTDQALHDFEFSSYAQGLYDFTWRDLCDWYIEAIKPTAKQNAQQRQVLASVLDATLRLLHPVMPYITEELWSHLNRVAPRRGLEGVTLPPSELLVRAAWPKLDPSLIDETVLADFDAIRQVITAIREVRTIYKIPPRQKIEASAKTTGPLAQKLLAQRTLVETLANITGREIGPSVEKPGDAASIVVGPTEIYLHGLVQADAEKARLGKRLDELTKSIANLEGRLTNKAYTDKAPPHLVQQTRDQLTAAQREKETLEQQMTALKA